MCEVSRGGRDDERNREVPLTARNGGGFTATRLHGVRIEGEILIRCPVNEVFDFVADQRNEPLYNPRMLRAEKGSSGPIGVGTRFRAATASMQRPAELTIDVTTYKRPRRLGSWTRLRGMDIRGDPHL